MKNFYIKTLFVITFISSLISYGQTMQMDIEKLANDSMEGREIGSKGEKKAAKYVKKRFKQIGLSPKGTEGYYQVFTAKPKINPHALIKVDTSKVIEGRNVIGFLNNNAKTTVIIGAHFDHLGYGNEGSLSQEKAIHNGADDNASGVTVLLHLATLLKNSYSNNNYLFIAFSGEEKGLWGSNWFTKHPTIDLATVNYMINLDMVGRLDNERKLAVYGTGTSPVWNTILSKIATENKVKMISKESGIGPSDHTSFYLQDMPVLHFFTGQHKDYHKPSDDADKINYAGMKVVQNFIEDVIAQVDTKGKLEFTKTKDESTNTPSFSVTLGVMPDYMYDGKGMRIEGVKENRPAHKAGIVQGDIILKIDTLEIKDMMAYMKALSRYKKGEKSDITVKRGAKELTLKVIW